MTRYELLSALGISDPDFTDYVKKIVAFRDGLNDAQKKLFYETLPTLQEAAQAFGPDCSVSDVQSLIGNIDFPGGVAAVGWCHRHKHKTEHDHGRE